MIAQPECNSLGQQLGTVPSDYCMPDQSHDATIVVPEQTNGYEQSLPDYLREEIAAYQQEHPDADRACWAHVLAYCMAASGSATNISPALVGVYTHALDAYTGDTDLPDLPLGSQLADSETTRKAAADLREEIATEVQS